MTSPSSPGGDRTFSLHGKVALVTGASRGIGAATAKLLAAQGASVGVNYVSNEARAREVVSAIEAAGGRAVAVRGSVGEQAEVEAMVRQVEEELGPIDILVCNADAVREFTVKPFVDLSWAEFEDLLTGETKAVFYPVGAVVGGMMKRGAGTIINVSSQLSRRAQEGMAGHSSGKAAVDALTRTLANELGPHGIRVNAVAPGLVQTEASASMWSGDQGQDGGPGLMARMRQMTPLRRIATPEDVAGAIVMLASDAASFVTGVYLDVNGGMTMR
ncbi:dehydrogenase (plasmid) [Deinococcus aetherius]|uniref:Dehydrogenase n=1 Tax=Deinococcus aetherius TaxID=200252 RepID=A0ABM8AKI5_9DEIO|nr:SDR family oxidoreductase [Deinococcus aetherius]BDP44327.1 dehydrogenase [Deinococcus aetherius]